MVQVFVANIRFIEEEEVKTHLFNINKEHDQYFKEITLN